MRAYIIFASEDSLCSDDVGIEAFSHCDDGTSRIVFAFVVGDSDNETQTQRKEHLESCTDATPGVGVPEAAVFQSRFPVD